jgi:hypothetical protein
LKTDRTGDGSDRGCSLGAVGKLLGQFIGSGAFATVVKSSVTDVIMPPRRRAAG